MAKVTKIKQQGIANVGGCGDAGSPAMSFIASRFRLSVTCLLCTCIGFLLAAVCGGAQNLTRSRTSK